MIIFLIPLVAGFQSYTTCQGSTVYNSGTFTCMSCPTNTVKYNSTLCVCDQSNGYAVADITLPFWNSGYCSKVSYKGNIYQLYQANGAAITPKALNCSTNAIADATNSFCVPCPHFSMLVQNGACICGTNYTQAKNTCVNSTLASTYTSIPTGNYFTVNGLYSLIGCLTFGSQDACQLLNNLCVISKYLSTGLFCQSYYTVQNSNTLLNLNKTNATYSQVQSFSTVSSLPFYVLYYSIEGKFIKQDQLTNELNLCSHPTTDITLSQQFGYNYFIECSIDMSKFLVDSQTYFYEVLLKDGTNYLQVPIVYVDESSDESYQNARFVMVDTISQTLDYTQNAPKQVRYPKKVKMLITPSGSSIDLISVPQIQITYALADPKTAVTVKFEVVSTMLSSQTSFFSVALGLFIACSVLGGLIGLFRLYVWTRANPPASLKNEHKGEMVVNGIRLILASWSIVIFWFLFIITGYWFVFFKLQSSPFILLLDLDDPTNYSAFNGIFYTVFAVRVILAIDLVIQQSNMKIFFIDWERTEFQRPRELDVEVKSKVSVWRSILVANEFNELSTERTVSIHWTLLIVGFLLIGLQVQGSAQELPSIKYFFHNIRTNYVLLYFISQFVYLGIGFIQLLLRRMLNIWQPYAYEDFVDLCTIANISIFILDDNLHGYYVHGENPFGFSEGSIEHLEACFRNESKNKGKNRGFISDGSELQTYEVYVPPKFKEQYDELYLTFRNAQDKEELRQFGLEKNEVQKFQIQEFLKKKLNEVRKNERRANNILTKETSQRYFDYPPDQINYEDFNNQQLPYMFRDQDYSFKNVFFYGHETTFLVLDTLFFNFWLMVTNNMPLSILLSYICHQVICYIKSSLQQDNISEKVKIDKRFLI